MSIHQQKKIWKIVKYSKVTGFIFFILSIFFFLEAFQFIDKSSQIKSKLREAEKENQTLLEKLSDRKQDLEFLQTERGKEEYIRVNMPVAKAGEEVIIFYDSSTSPVQVLDIKTPWYKDFFNKFKSFIATYTYF